MTRLFIREMMADCRNIKTCPINPRQKGLKHFIYGWWSFGPELVAPGSFKDESSMSLVATERVLENSGFGHPLYRHGEMGLTCCAYNRHLKSTSLLFWGFPFILYL